MKPHRKWFHEYEEYDGGDVCLSDYSATRTINQGRGHLMLKDS